jgi:GT2 family glycosyltransferase
MERIVALVDESLAATRDSSRMPLPCTGHARTAVSIIIPVDNGSQAALLPTLEAIANNSAPELFEVVLVNCAADRETRAVLESLSGDVVVIDGASDWSYAEACNEAVKKSQGKYLVFLKPGLAPAPGWLEGLLQVAEAEHDFGAVGGQVLNHNGLIWQIGVAFDVNQSPFALYRLLPREFAGASKQREFEAVEFPLLVSRELFCRLGGLNADLHNRLEDVDFCLTLRCVGLRVLYTPGCVITRLAASWHAVPEKDDLSRIRFYSKWTGQLWQNDARYLLEDGLTHDGLSALYREFAARVAGGAAELANDSVALVN